jgi:ABC-type nitrate/sulfonate/bicarbonate transport system substrate-binding protein
MNDQTLRRFLQELHRAAEFNRTHPGISAERYAAVMDVVNALEKALGYEPSGGTEHG